MRRLNRQEGGSRQVKTIAVVYNLRRHRNAGDEEEEYDEQETIDAVCVQIQAWGISAVALEYTPRLTQDLIEHKPDLVLNIAEGAGKTRSRESQVPCILESLRIPYSGADPIALGVTLDKYLTHTVLSSAGIPVPQITMVRTQRDIPVAQAFLREQGRCLVKPRWEGSSKGITGEAVVDSYAALRRQATRILDQYGQPALVEEFLEGEEITAGVYGNDRPRVLGMMRISPRQASAQPFVYSLENKREWRTRVLYEAEDRIASRVRENIRRFAQKSFAALELRDIARIDFRAGRDRVPKVIDVNPLPGLSPAYSDLPILCRLNGVSYPRLIRLILSGALQRYGFSLPEKRS